MSELLPIIAGEDTDGSGVTGMHFIRLICVWLSSSRVAHMGKELTTCAPLGILVAPSGAHTRHPSSPKPGVSNRAKSKERSSLPPASLLLDLGLVEVAAPGHDQERG